MHIKTKFKFKKGDRVTLPFPSTRQGTVLISLLDRSMGGELLPFVLVKLDKKLETKFGFISSVAFFQETLSKAKDNETPLSPSQT